MLAGTASRHCREPRRRMLRIGVREPKKAQSLPRDTEESVGRKGVQE